MMRGVDTMPDTVPDSMPDTVPDTLLAGAVEDAVVDAALRSQAAIDEFLLHPLVRRPVAATALFVQGLHADESHAMASLAGADVPRAAYSHAVGQEDPLGLRLRSAAAVYAAALRDATVMAVSPPRALSAWHLLATAGAGLTDDQRGRPVTATVQRADVGNDVLHAAVAPMDPSVTVPAVVTAVVGVRLPAVTAAAAVHALLAAGQPFASDNALLGRAALRAVLCHRGSDPDGLLPVNTTLLRAGRPALVKALRGAIDEGRITTEWFLWHAQVLADAAAAASRAADQAMSELT